MFRFEISAERLLKERTRRRLWLLLVDNRFDPSFEYLFVSLFILPFHYSFWIDTIAERFSFKADLTFPVGRSGLKEFSLEIDYRLTYFYSN